MRVWQIRLAPGERHPAHRHVLDYFWTALTDGHSRQHTHIPAEQVAVVDVESLVGATGVGRRPYRGLGQQPGMWPKIARFFDLEVAAPLPMSLEVVMADKAPLWQQMTAAYGLESHTYEELSSWPFGDFVFSWDYDMFADGTKARRFGFHEFVDTEQMFLGILADLRERRTIP